MTREFDFGGQESDADHLEEHTVVVSADNTVVVARDDTVAITNDRTRVVVQSTRRERRIAENSRRDEVERAAQLSRSQPVPPIEQAADERDLQKIIGTGLDPDRPIAPAPGTLPWEAIAERGVTRGLPVSYGARPNAEMPLRTGHDEIFRTIGPAPAQSEVHVAQHREQLPSLRERDRRRKVTTLAVYSAVIVFSVVGLYVVAAIAFGW